MRQDSIQKRKNRIIFQRLFISFGVFLCTLLLCVLLFGWKYLVGERVTSPLASYGSSGDKATDSIVYTIKSFCEENKIPCSNISESQGGVTITLDNGSSILLSSQKDLQKQLTSLQLTLSQLTIEGKQFKKLDFRFEKPFATF